MLHSVEQDFSFQYPSNNLNITRKTCTEKFRDISETISTFTHLNLEHSEEIAGINTEMLDQNSYRGRTDHLPELYLLHSYYVDSAIKTNLLVKQILNSLSTVYETFRSEYVQFPPSLGSYLNEIDQEKPSGISRKILHLTSQTVLDFEQYHENIVKMALSCIQEQEICICELSSRLEKLGKYAKYESAEEMSTAQKLGIQQFAASLKLTKLCKSKEERDVEIKTKLRKSVGIEEEQSIEKIIIKKVDKQLLPINNKFIEHLKYLNSFHEEELLQNEQEPLQSELSDSESYLLEDTVKEIPLLYEVKERIENCYSCLNELQQIRAKSEEQNLLILPLTKPETEIHLQNAQEFFIQSANGFLHNSQSLKRIEQEMAKSQEILNLFKTKQIHEDLSQQEEGIHLFINYLELIEHSKKPLSTELKACLKHGDEQIQELKKSLLQMNYVHTSLIASHHKHAEFLKDLGSRVLKKHNLPIASGAIFTTPLSVEEMLKNLEAHLATYP